MANTKNTNTAFTLIELLVVIALIGILSSVVLAALSGARESARETAAQSDLNSIHTAVQMMLNDIGAGPGGCNGATEGNIAGNLDSVDAGLVSKPSVGGGRWSNSV